VLNGRPNRWRQRQSEHVTEIDGAIQYVIASAAPVAAGR
jgi:hypothetical protein